VIASMRVAKFSKSAYIKVVYFLITYEFGLSISFASNS
jgi:hypothetical protein